MGALQTDYLVVGAGASGLAFADTLLDQSDADIIIVDRHDRPGGHWNDAYPFVRLHQPAAFYGVNSLELWDGKVDRDGPNAGLLGLASLGEITSYFEKVMKERLLPSGRVRFLPNHEHLGQGRLRPILGSGDTDVSYRRLVDSTYYGTSVPSTHQPHFKVGEGTALVPPNALPMLWKRRDAMPEAFVILGAGKTAMDAAVWLLSAGVEPDRIHWVRPRDSWVYNRAKVQPGRSFLPAMLGAQAELMRAMGEATDTDEVFERLEAAGYMLRIDRNHRASMFHYATCSEAEVAMMGRIEKVIRKGRVAAIEPGAIRFADADVTVPENSLFIDCTASAIVRKPPVPVFDGDTVTLQMIRGGQPAFSAALAAFIDVHVDGEAAKNRLAVPIPLPDRIEDFAAATLVNMANQQAWMQDDRIRGFILASRLDGYGKTIAAIGPDDAEMAAMAAELRRLSRAAVPNMQALAAAATNP